MIVTELASNAWKHGFGAAAAGRIDVRVTRAGDALRLEVEDDGVGLPAAAQAERPATFGLQLVRNLVQQVEGQITFGDEARGTRVTVTVPLARAG
jgi:two-component sensor histidine kinase